MADLWSMYGVRKAGQDHKAGIGPLPKTEAFGCGTCGMSFGKELYPDVNAFYFGHVERCRLSIHYLLDEWQNEL